MDLPISPTPPPATRWLTHLAPVLCHLGALWLAAREVLAPAPAGWLAPAADFPLYTFGLGLAGLIWLHAGLRAKGWVHVLAAMLLSAPRIYSLPTDLFGVTPSIALSLGIGVYLHVALWRDRAMLRGLGAPVPIAALFAGLFVMHILAAHAFEALQAGFRALGQP